MRRKRSRRQVSPRALEEIQKLYREGYGPTEVHRLLESNEEFASEFSGEAGRKKVQRIIREDLQPIDNSGEWSFAETDDPAGARLVLDVLAHLIEETDGRVQTLTNLEAEWIVRLRTAYADMPITDVWRYTYLYAGRILKGEETLSLDRFVALEPWNFLGYEDEDAQFAISLLFDPNRPDAVKEMIRNLVDAERRRNVGEDVNGEAR